jgi:hypothetical protein
VRVNEWIRRKKIKDVKNLLRKSKKARGKKVSSSLNTSSIRRKKLKKRRRGYKKIIKI